MLRCYYIHSSMHSSRITYCGYWLNPKPYLVMVGCLKRVKVVGWGGSRGELFGSPSGMLKSMCKVWRAHVFAIASMRAWEIRVVSSRGVGTLPLNNKLINNNNNSSRSRSPLVLKLWQSQTLESPHGRPLLHVPNWLAPRLGMSIGEDERALWPWLLRRRRRPRAPRRLPQQQFAAASAIFSPSPPAHARSVTTRALEEDQHKAREMKYVLVTGGVVSGLGKGVTASSIGVVLKACGLRVTSVKIDPYLNTDAGTMSPFEHGEVFVLDDGGEVDLDLGNYERFLDITLTRDNNITTGKIYQSVIERERRGDYLGKTVQVVPHITDCIQDWIARVARVPVDGIAGSADVCVIELGGTVGDIESMPFIEALRQFQFRVGRDNFCLVHVSLVPVLGVVGEQKTKPTQHSVRELRAYGLTPHLLACRSAQPLEQATKEKLSQFCDVPADHILNIHDVSNIWHVPLLLRDQKGHIAIFNKLNLSSIPPPALESWATRTMRCDNLSIPVKIVMVGKYTGLSDSYLSVLKALQHACIACSRKLVLEWVAATDLEEHAKIERPDSHTEAWAMLKRADGVLVPGGFGDRGVQGKILAANYARTNEIPYLGICLGMQIAVVEFARNVLGLEDANSTEFNSATPHPCVVFMPEVSKTQMGGTMRLGSRKTLLQTSDCMTAKLYQKETFIDERHRHRYEVNPEMVERLETAGLQFVGKDETGRRMEIVELPGHPYYVGVQFHPEFKSRPGKPSAVFLGLILAASGQMDSYISGGHGSSIRNPTPPTLGQADSASSQDIGLSERLEKL